MPQPAREELRIPCGETELAAWFYRPEDAGGDAPCVVLLHGFSATRDEQLDRFCERFAGAGVAALAFDYRHFGASGGEPRQLVDIERQYEDCDAALAHVRQLDGIDATRIIVWGTSFAGGFGVDAAVRHPWIAAVICLVPLMDGAAPPPGMTARRAAWVVAVSVRDRAHERLGRRPYRVAVVGRSDERAFIANDAASESIARMVPPHSLWKNEVCARVLLQVRHHRPVKRAADVTCPLLVQIADDETVVAMGAARKVVATSPRAELKTYPGLDHFDVYVSPGSDAIIDDQIAFLERALAGQ